MIHLATNSPSLPASVAMMISFTSFLNNCFFTSLYCLPVFFKTVSFMCFGSIGRVSIFHSLYLLSYPSGSISPTKCPIAQVTIYLFPSIYEPLFTLHFKTFAKSLPTEGFSASINDFPILRQTTFLFLFSKTFFKLIITNPIFVIIISFIFH